MFSATNPSHLRHKCAFLVDCRVPFPARSSAADWLIAGARLRHVRHQKAFKSNKRREIAFSTCFNRLFHHFPGAACMLRRSAHSVPGQAKEAPVPPVKPGFPPLASRKEPQDAPEHSGTPAHESIRRLPRRRESGCTRTICKLISMTWRPK
jgi:hypothetical protein